MANTFFQDYNQNTPIVASWLNDVNKVTYSATTGTAKNALQSAAAWARFSVSGGVVTIVQSSNINTIVRTGTGVYVVNYSVPMVHASNSYGFSMPNAGFVVYSGEILAGFTINCTDTTNTALDPVSVCFQVFGAN